MSLVLLALAFLSATNNNPDHETTTKKELNAVTEIQGYSCAAGNAWFFSDGKLASCFVSHDTTFGELAVPQKSWINVGREGEPRFVFLSRDTKLNGYVCRGGKGDDYSTALYPDGKLKTCWLAADSQVDGFPCMRANFKSDVFGGGVETDFFESGRLKACKLAADMAIQGKGLHKGDHILLDERGVLLQ